MAAREVSAIVIDPSSPRMPPPIEAVKQHFGPFHSRSASPSSAVHPYHDLQQYVPDVEAEVEAYEERPENISCRAMIDQRSYDFALRDAAARFEETRRLAIEVASLQHQLHTCRTEHEADILRAAEREAALTSRAAAAEEDARSGESREVVELGARAQVATWRYTQAIRQAEESEVERKQVASSLQAAESKLATAEAERASMQRARDRLQVQVRELSARECELARQLERERELRAEERTKLREQASAAVSEATSNACNARQDSTLARRALEAEREARLAAESKMDLLAAAAAAAEAKATGSERARHECELRVEKELAEAMQREREIADQRAAQAAEWSAERQAASQALSEQVQQAESRLVDVRRKAAADLEDAVCAARAEVADACMHAIAVSASRGFARRRQRQALGCWKSLVMERVRAHSTWAGEVEGAGRMAHRLRGVKAAFDAFAVSGTLRRTSARATRYNQERVARRAVHTWSAFVECAERDRRACSLLQQGRVRTAIRLWEEHSDAEATACRAARCLLHMKARRAFNTWQRLLEGMDLTVHALLHRSVAALRHQATHRAWSAWMLMVSARHRALLLLRGAVGEMAGKGVRRAWLSWQAACDRVTALRRCAARMRMQAEARSWRSWVHNVDERARALRQLQWVGGALRHRRTRCALSSWVAWLEAEGTQRAIRSMLQRCAMAFKRKDERAALLCWHAHCRHTARTRLRVRAAAERWMGRGCGRAWSKWRAVTSTAALLSRHLTALKMQKERAAWSAWKESTGKLMWLRGILRRISPANRQARQAFNSWVHGTREVGKAHKAIVALMNRQVRRAFNAWLRRGAMLQAAWRAVQRSLLMLSNATLGRAWRQWASAWEWPKVAKRLALSFNTVLLRKGMVEWRLCSQKGRGERALRKFAKMGRQAAAERQALAVEMRLLEKGSSRAEAAVVAAKAELTATQQQTAAEQRRVGRLVEAAEAKAASLRAELEDTRGEMGREAAARENLVRGLRREIDDLRAEAARAEEAHQRADRERARALAEAEAAQEAAADAVAAAEAAVAQAALAAAETHPAEPSLMAPSAPASAPAPPAEQSKASPPKERVTAEAPPPSESLLRHTMASKGWDNSHRRASLKAQQPPPPFRAPGEKRDSTFSATGFLEQSDLDRGRQVRPISPVEGMGAIKPTEWKQAAYKTWGVREWGRASSNLTAAALAYAPQASPTRRNPPSAVVAGSTAEAAPAYRRAVTWHGT